MKRYHESIDYGVKRDTKMQVLGVIDQLSKTHFQSNTSYSSANNIFAFSSTSSATNSTTSTSTTNELHLFSSSSASSSISSSSSSSIDLSRKRGKKLSFGSHNYKSRSLEHQSGDDIINTSNIAGQYQFQQQPQNIFSSAPREIDSWYAKEILDLCAESGEIINISIKGYAIVNGDGSSDGGDSFLSSSIKNDNGTSPGSPLFSRSVLNKTKKYTVFILYVTCSGNKNWIVYRRYNDFRDLCSSMSRVWPNHPPLPPKNLFFTSNFSDDFLKKRQSELDGWLSVVLKEPNILSRVPEFQTFFSRDVNKPPEGFIHSDGYSTPFSSTVQQSPDNRLSVSLLPIATPITTPNSSPPTTPTRRGNGVFNFGNGGIVASHRNILISSDQILHPSLISPTLYAASLSQGIAISKPKMPPTFNSGNELLHKMNLSFKKQKRGISRFEIDDDGESNSTDGEDNVNVNENENENLIDELVSFDDSGDEDVEMSSHDENNKTNHENGISSSASSHDAANDLLLLSKVAAVVPFNLDQGTQQSQTFVPKSSKQQLLLMQQSTFIPPEMRRFGEESPGKSVRHLNSTESIHTIGSVGKTNRLNARKIGLNDFEMIRVLGKGSFGKVILCRKKDTGVCYAVKVLKKQHVVVRKQVQHTKTERSVLGKIDHPFIVKLHFAFQTGDKLHFVLTYAPGGELFFHLGRAGKFSEELGRFYAAEISLALGYLHSKHVVYRDLKPENILLDREGHVLLADFGLSKEGIVSGTEGTHSFCGTPEYLAPEVLNRVGHGTSVDWWSLGALLYEMLTGLPPWYSQERQKLFAGIRRGTLGFPSHVSVKAQMILSAFLQRDPLIRLGSKRGVEEVKEHQFFDVIDWNALYAKKVQPPFSPCSQAVVVSSTAEDTGNFEDTFTRMPFESVCQPTDTIGIPNPKLSLESPNHSRLSADFIGFTFEDSNFPALHNIPSFHSDGRTPPFGSFYNKR